MNLGNAGHQFDASKSIVSGAYLNSHSFEIVILLLTQTKHKQDRNVRPYITLFVTVQTFILHVSEWKFFFGDTPTVPNRNAAKNTSRVRCDKQFLLHHEVCRNRLASIAPHSSSNKKCVGSLLANKIRAL